MTPFTVIWCALAALVVFGLLEGVMLGAMISSELAGVACGARLLPDGRAPARRLGSLLAGLDRFLGHTWVGLMLPYVVLAGLAPRSDWLVGLATVMVAASLGIGGAAMLAGFLAGLLTSRPGLPVAGYDAMALKQDPAGSRFSSIPPEAA